MRGILVFVLSAISVLSAGNAYAKKHTTVFENGVFYISEPTVFDDIYIGVGAIVGLDADILVTGNIHVSGGAWLTAIGITVLGEVEFEGAAVVDLENSIVRHDVAVTHTGGAPVFGLLPSIYLTGNSIGGDLEVKNNNVNSIKITNNKIHGDFELKRNVSVFPSDISNNLTHVKGAGK